MGMQIKGVQRLNDEILRLMQEPNKKAGTAAISKGINVITKIYRQAAPTGNATRTNRRAYRQTGIAISRTPMKQSVGRKVRRGNSKRGPMAKAGYNVGKKGTKRAFYASAVAVGTQRRVTKKGQNRGSIRPLNAGRQVTAAIPRAIQAMRTELKARLRSR